MVSRISTLPNYCSGKLYKRWDSVANFFGERSVVASKTNKKGEVTQLLIQGDRQRELYADTYKIMDLKDNDNIRRTYVYQRTTDGIEGKMIVEKLPQKDTPLITSANWTIKNLIPQEVNLTLNTEHPKAKMMVKISEQFEEFNKFCDVIVQKIKAVDFMGPTNPRPRSIELTLKDGSVIKSDNPALGNIFVSSCDVSAENHPMAYMNVVV